MTAEQVSVHVRFKLTRERLGGQKLGGLGALVSNTAAWHMIPEEPRIG